VSSTVTFQAETANGTIVHLFDERDLALAWVAANAERLPGLHAVEVTTTVTRRVIKPLSLFRVRPTQPQHLEGERHYG
jgi:hypothetical protein